MDKATLQELRDASEQRCIEQYNIVENAKVELERVRGEFRALEALLRNWKDDKEPKKNKE